MPNPPGRRRNRFDWARLEARTVPTTLVALIDSGVDLTAAADLPYYDFSAAYDAYDKQAVTPSTHSIVQDTSYQHGHGSSVADFIVEGIADASGQAGAGSVDVKIMPVRDTPPGAISPDNGALIRGVFWAVDHGASVINLSLRQYDQDFFDTTKGDTYYGDSLSQAIAYAKAHNVAVVTAAGNESVNVDGPNPYGSFIMPGGAGSSAHNGLGVSLDNLLVTAAVDGSNKLTTYSNWGPTTVNLGAPTGTGTNAVTSYSTGYASGVMGVVAALTPSMTVEQRLGLVESTTIAAPQDAGAWSTTGGVIDPADAVRRAISVVDLGSTFNAVGITADSAPAVGNLDGAHNSFSGSLVGATVTQGGSTFDLGPAGSSDAVQAKGQSIPLPASASGSLRLLATAVNGTQFGTFTVTYADGTTAKTTLTLDDWHNGALAPGEASALATTYRNSSGGKDTANSGFSLYAYTIPLDPTKTPRSLTLPVNANIALFAADLASATSKAVDLSGQYNVIGITNDGATSSGNLDGVGYSFSATLLGTAVASGGVGFNLGPAGASDAVQGTGQSIPLPSMLGGSLRLLATAVNGQQSGTFIVTYTDGTTARTTLTLDDWHATTPLAVGESSGLISSYRNGSGGKDTNYSNFSLYSYTITLDPTKTLKSLTLPNNHNVALFAASITPAPARAVDLSNQDNVVGITADFAPAAGNLDGTGNSYSSTLLGSSATAIGLSFNLGAAGSSDAVAAKGQTLSLPSGKYSSLALLGAGVNGNQSGTFTVTYTDGTTASIAQTFDDWYNGPKARNEGVGVASSYRNATSGKDGRSFSLYDYSLAIDPTRTISTLTLPNNANIAIFALDLVP